MGTGVSYILALQPWERLVLGFSQYQPRPHPLDWAVEVGREGRDRVGQGRRPPRGGLLCAQAASAQVACSRASLPRTGVGAALCLSVTPLALGEGQAPSLCWLHVAAGRPAALCWGLSSSRCLTPCATWSHPLLLPSEILPVQAEPPSQAQKQIVCVRVCLCVHTEIEIILDDM